MHQMVALVISRLLVGLWVVMSWGCQSSDSASPAPVQIEATDNTRQVKQVAITLDDGPIMRFFSHPTQWHRTLVIDSLTNALARYQAPTTLFAIGGLVQGEEPAAQEGAALLRYWMEKGIPIANHTMSHTNFNELSLGQGIDEITEANEVLKPFAQEYNQTLKYFRFPFLAEGQTFEKKDAWNKMIVSLGLTNARVTMSNRDWDFDKRYMDAELAEEWELRYEIGQEYMAHMRETMAFWDSLAVDLTGRNIKHVLLLHANRINRDYLGQILFELSGQGYEFISLEEAYTDPIYSEPDEWFSENGTSFLEHIKQTRLKNAPPPAEADSSGGDDSQGEEP